MANPTTAQKTGQQDVTDKISASWLQIEREKSQLVAAINGLTLGLLITDDHNNIVTNNTAAEKILGKTQEIWNLAEIQKNIKGNFDLPKTCLECLSKKQTAESPAVAYGEKSVKFFLTPIEVLKSGLAVLGVTIVVEEVTAQQIEKQKSTDFFAIASHQIKAPLSIIRADTELIQKTYPDILKDQNLNSLIEEIQDEAIRSISITHEFMDIARIEEGKINFAKEPFAVPQLVEEIAKNFSTIVRVKGIDMKIEKYDPNIPNALADPQATKHILFNLIDNAIKFTEKGGITIEIAAQAEFIKVRITNTGVEIPQEKQIHLFEKFASENNGESSGIGLYIAKLFTESMGGKIQLEKTSKDGTTFTFTLPIEKPNTGSIIVDLKN